MVASQEASVHSPSATLWHLGSRRRFLIFPRALAVTDQSSPRNATVRDHDARPVGGPGPHRTARTNWKTTPPHPRFQAPSHPYHTWGSLMIKSCFVTLHVWPVHQGSDRRPPRHSSPNLRLQNFQRAKLSSVGRSQFTMSSFMWLPGQRCIPCRFVLPISSILPHCLSQIPHLAN